MSKVYNRKNYFKIRRLLMKKKMKDFIAWIFLIIGTAIGVLLILSILKVI